MTPHFLMYYVNYQCMDGKMIMVANFNTILD